jgi:glycosyltransferase involved in cell wall biosynthesis
MPSLVLAVPGQIETRTGGYGYDRQIAAGLRASGWDVRVLTLDASFPEPTPQGVEHAARALAAIPDGTAVLIDGLALGAMPAEAEREQTRLRLFALVHHPLARETGIAPAAAERLDKSERRALRTVRRVVVTSRATAETLLDYGVPRDRVTVVEPGTDRLPLARGSGNVEVHLLCVASIVPRKGHDVLMRALSQVREGPWRLTCVGSLDRDAVTTEALRRAVHDLGLGARVSLAGELEGDRLAAAYDSADVFVLATRYEGYGMAVAEAIACGLPVVATATGAIDDVVGGAGIVVPPGDEQALAGALQRVIGSRELREDLAMRARGARERLPGWDDASRRMAEVVSVEFQP